MLCLACHGVNKGRCFTYKLTYEGPARVFETKTDHNYVNTYQLRMTATNQSAFGCLKTSERILEWSLKWSNYSFIKEIT